MLYWDAWILDDCIIADAGFSFHFITQVKGHQAWVHHFIILLFRHAHAFTLVDDILRKNFILERLSVLVSKIDVVGFE